MVNNITDQMNMNLSKFWEMVEDRGAWRATVHSVAESEVIYKLNNNKNNKRCIIRLRKVSMGEPGV